MLRRLRDRGLLAKQGAGSRTYYTLASAEPLEILDTRQPELPLGIPLSTNGNGMQAPETDPAACNPELATLPSELATLLATLKGRVNAEALRDGIRRLCAWAPLTVDQLATFLDKDRHYLRNKHLIPMVREGQLRFRYPETAKHPHQAYVASGDENTSHD